MAVEGRRRPAWAEVDLAAISGLDSWLQRATGAFVANSHARTFPTRPQRIPLFCAHSGQKPPFFTLSNPFVASS